MGSMIRWLHLTDLHVGMNDQDWLWPRMRIKFRDDLRKISEAAGPWDLVLFTGDLVQKGMEYAKLDEVFDDLWRWFAELGCDPELLAIPGNHDLQWRDAKDPVVTMLQKWDSESDVREGYWNEAGGPYRQTVMEAFSDYEAWWRDTTRKPDGVRHGELPGDFACTFTKGDLRLGIVGLNSAFLQLTAKRGRGRGTYRGHLAVDPRQFHGACDGDGVKWAESHHACLLMTHHPPEWLHKESLRVFDAEIMESFFLHLCGHNHETRVLQELTGGAEHAALRWQGRSLFGLEKAGNGKLDRSHGYAAGELRMDDDTHGQLQFMPRVLVPQGGPWSLVPDHAGVQLPDDRRTRAFSVPLRRLGVGSKIRAASGATSSADKTELVDAMLGSAADATAFDGKKPADPGSTVSPLGDDLQEREEEEVDRMEKESRRPEPGSKRAFIANELLQVVCDQLNSDSAPLSALRAQLIAYLTEGANDDAEASVALMAKALTEQLNRVLSTLRIWLDSTDFIEGKEQVRRLIDAVATAGFEAAWIEELLAEVETRHLRVPVETDLHLCEIIFTALYRKPATWIRDKEIDHAALRTIATPSTKPRERAREIRRRLVETHFKDRISREVGESDQHYQRRLDKWADRDLPSILEAEREDQKPWFVLFLETVDALKTDMAIDPELWSQVLKFEKSAQDDRFVYDRPKLQDRLIEMHKRLDELDPKARKGTTS